MSDTLRILQVEDSESDASLVLRQLQKAGYEIHSRRVEDAGEMREALAGQKWDVIIADNQLPRFSASEALRVVQKTGQDIPFIVVSGNIGEDAAVAMMKAGAHDYILKNKLARLAPAVEREIREAGDRSRRRQVEEALRIGEERLAAIIDTAMDAIITVDDKQIVVLFNAAAERIFGCPAGDVIGKPLDRFLPERFRESHRSHVRTFGITGATARSMNGAATLSGRRANGEEFPMEATISRTTIGGQQLYTVILRDITQRKQAEELAALYAQSKELDRFKTEFFDNLSHELRTPLTLILGPVRRRLAARGLTVQERRGLKLVERNALLLLSHVNDMLDLAKIDAGRIIAEYTRVDLGQLVRRVASNFESVGVERRVALEIEAPESLPADVDSSKLERVLLNLLSNAFKFTPDGGKVRIAVYRAGERGIVEVEDTGPGVPPAMREAIFERFRQLDLGPDSRFGGTGLGLSIVKQLVSLHGGTISVEEPRLGSGTLFRVALPLAAPGGTDVRQSAEEPDVEAIQQAVEELRPPEPPGPVPAAATASGAPVVLLVEDNLFMNAFITETLSPAYRVHRAFDGHEGLRKALELHPDLILSDIMMPRMNGDRMVREIRLHGELEDVPIVLLTAKVDDELQLKLLKEGAQDYLLKPFDGRTLLAKVGRLIADRRRRKEAEDALHRLSGSLLQVHDQERKQVAYELHENIVQCLAALQINLSMATEGTSLSPEAQGILDDGHALLERCVSELQTMSYGLHPLLLDHFGLKSAVEGYIKGFIRRSGISVISHTPPDLGRLPAEHELTLFRIVQEALTNLQCHSGIGKVEVCAFRNEFEVGLEVIAGGDGCFAKGEPAADLGIDTMRERVRKLGGQLEIASGAAETTLRVVLPLHAR